jgi:hypothetical protein
VYPDWRPMSRQIPRLARAIGVVPQHSVHGGQPGQSFMVDTDFRLNIQLAGNDHLGVDMTREMARNLQSQLNTLFRGQSETCGPECGHHVDLVQVCSLCGVTVEDELSDEPCGVGDGRLETTIGTFDDALDA